MKNLTLCVLLHVFGKTTTLCRCPLNDEQENEKPPTTINITYIEQKGNANIAGDGTVQFKTSQDHLAQVERLKKENTLLSELLGMLKNKPGSGTNTGTIKPT
ncbi:MAG: hypothetical protein ABIN80_28545 [Dyadobacter sp.]|uniref:hypothetical protein n=1 Tax=Dyadobacter sp. TaxID=1914288 RepID=UPI003266FCEB